MKRLSAALVILCAWLLPVLAFAATSAQMTNGRQQFLNGSGAPLASGAVYIYQPGTTTPVTTYQDPNLTTANTNPIILDSNGMASIWVQPGNYREVVQDSVGNVLFDQTTSAVGTASASLSPGATIGTNGDVSCSATQFTGASNITLPCTINANAVTNTDLAQMAANTLKGNNTGGAANTADLTVAQASAMLAATGAQVKAGTSNGVLISPAAFVAAGQGTNVSCGSGCTGGYVTEPGGITYEWGYYSGSVSQGTVVTITFPLAFTTACYSANATIDLTTHGANNAYSMATNSACSTTSISFIAQGYQSGGTGAGAGFYWVAFGK